MDYASRINGIVSLLRAKQIDAAYGQTQVLIQKVAGFIGSLNAVEEEDKDALKDISNILEEIFYAMNVNDVIYLCDLLKYELAVNINKLKVEMS